MFKSFRPEANDLELIDKEEYTLLKDNNEIKFIIGKTKTKKYLVIQAQYEHNNINDFFQTKLTLNNLKEKSKYFANALSIDECYVLITNLFQDDNIYVKDIINKNCLKLVHQYNEKNIEINLLYKKNIFLHKSYTHVESNNMNLNINKVLKIEEIKEERKSNENNKEHTNDNNDINNNNKEIKENEEKKDTEMKSEDKSNNDLDNKKEDISEQNNNMENNDKIIKIEKNNDDINNNNNNSKNEDNKIISEEKNNIINDDNNINENSKEHNILKNEDNNENSNNDINDNLNINLENKEKDNEENNNKNEGKKNENENDKEQTQIKIIEEDNNKNNNLNNSNIDVNKLLEKIKRLEEENKQLKIENKELKDKLSHINYNEEKLKKSEKEKEKLKIELQKLKNSLNGKGAVENKQKNNISSTNEDNKRQNSILFPTKLDLSKSKKENKITQKDIPTKLEKENTSKNIINSNRNKDKEKEKIDNPNKINIESKPPINLKIHKTVTQSSYILYSLDNCFTAFTSLNNELLLVYATKIKSIECFDLIKQKYHKTILNAHKEQILTIRHYCSKNINKDLIISGSNGDFCVKIWDVETWTCIFNINKIYQKGNMYSICILFDEYQKESFVFTSSDCDYIKIWGFDGKFIKNINKTNNNAVYLIDTYYDKKEYKYYLISGEMRCVKSYELNTHQLFRIYSDNNSFSEHVSAFIYTQGEVEKLVESEFYGSVRIWNFHTGNIIKKIDICRRIPLVSMCLWNENYLLVSCVDNTIKLIDFKNYALIKSFSGHNNEVCTIKKIIHPTFGECLLSQGLANDQIKMWINS